MTVYEVILIDMLWFVRNIVIAIKYAYCTDAEIEDMRRAFITRQVNRDRMILTGWITISPEAVERQIRLAALRQSVDVDSLHFRCVPGLTKADLQMYLPHVVEDSRAFGLQSRLVQDKDGLYTRFPLVTVISQLVLDGNRHKVINIYAISVILAIIFASLALITRAIERVPVMGGITWHDYVVTTCMLVSLFIAIWTNFGYLFAGITDFSRRRLIQRHLSMIITRGYEPLVSQRAKDGPQFFLERGPLLFDLTVPENVAAWWASRQVLEDFGLTFYRRINGYTGAFIIFALAMIISLYYVVFTGQHIASVAIFVQVGYSFVILLIIISLLVMYGGRTNQIRREQSLIFLRKKVLLETIVLDSVASEEVKRQLQLSIDMLASVARLVDIDNMQQNITILGFEAGGQFARSLMAVAIAGLGVFLRTFA